MIDYAFETDVLLSSSWGVRIIDHYPDIVYGKPQISRTSVPGRKGTLTEFDGTYDDTTVSMDCDIMLFNDLSVDIQFQRFSQALSQAKKLMLEGMEDRFFKIKTVEISDYDRYADSSIAFSIKFTCDPGVYLLSGDVYEKWRSGRVYNLYSEAEPIYKIEGKGQCTLTVNDFSVTGYVDGCLYIDTVNMDAYQSDGSRVNNLVKGNYKDLYLKPGENHIDITSGFSLYVKSGWRWMIS